MMYFVDGFFEKINRSSSRDVCVVMKECASRRAVYFVREFGA